MPMERGHRTVTAWQGAVAGMLQNNMYRTSEKNKQMHMATHMAEHLTRKRLPHCCSTASLAD